MEEFAAELIPISDLYSGDGTMKRSVLIDNEWVELYSQEHAVQMINWQDVKYIRETSYITLEEAKNRFGHLATFPN